MVTLEEPFKALADATRRAILGLLAARGRPVHEIADGFPMSRPAISKHLRLLREAGLVDEERVGRRRIYRLEPEGLVAAKAWIAELLRQAVGAAGTGVAAVEAATDPRSAAHDRQGAEEAAGSARPAGGAARPTVEPAARRERTTRRRRRPEATAPIAPIEPSGSDDEGDWRSW